MHIEFSNRFKIQELDVACNIKLSEGKVNLLVGDNGVGKSSLIRFFKLNQKEFFPGKKVNFMDQFPLRPINQISYLELKDQLNGLCNDELTFFKDLESSTKDFQDKPINDLSGGQNQMIKFLVTCFTGGDIFILDEPLQYLDKKNTQRLKNIIEQLKSLGKTIIIVEHQSEKIKELVDKIFTIECLENRVQVS